MTLELGRDLKLAARGLARAPGLTVAALLCLGLGLGATTAVFTAVDAALVRPLPLADPDELVSVFRTTPQFVSGPFSPANFYDLRRGATSLSGLAALTPGTALVRQGRGSFRASTTTASDNLFSVLGVAPVLGRLFRSGDEDLDQPAAVVLSEEVWRDRFGGDPGMVGRTLSIDGEPREVVGILPRAFRVPHGGRVFASDVWLPLRLTPEERSWRRSNSLMLVGRMNAGVDVAGADVEMRRIMAGIIEQVPELQGEQLRVTSLQRESVAGIRGPLTLLMGAVGLVLLIVMANVASLMLARGVARRGEWAIRMALGAGARRIMAAAMLEAGLLGGAGIVLGLALAWGGVTAIGRLVPPGLPQLAHLSIDRLVLGFALVLAAVVVVGTAAAPALQASRSDPQDALRAETRGGAGGRHHRFLKGLVVAEVALTLVLVLSAGLVLRGFGSLLGRDPGFDPSSLLVLDVDVPPENYEDRMPYDAFLQPALERLRALPDVEEAGVISLVPYENWGWNFNVMYEGRERDDPTRLPLVETRVATPSLFAMLDMRLLSGRLLRAADETDDAPLVAVANRALAERDFPGEDAVGKRFWRGDGFATIVGVVDDIRNFGPDRDPRPEVYFPWGRASRGSTSFPVIVRTRGEPAAAAREIARAVLEVESGAAVSRVRTMDEVISESMGRPRFYLALLGTFAGVALALALAGLYGVMSYLVAQRTREIGVRAAMGSSPRASVALILRGGLALIVAGTAIGLVAAGAATRLLEGMLFGVSPLDPRTWLAVIALMAGTASLAALLAARRAAAIEPMEAMRAD